MSIIECPNCGITIEVLEINCKIFRCGVIKTTMEQIPPHSSKEDCDKFVMDDLIYGCSKPFYFDGTNATKYDYLYIIYMATRKNIKKLKSRRRNRKTKQRGGCGNGQCMMGGSNAINHSVKMNTLKVKSR